MTESVFRKFLEVVDEDLKQAASTRKRTATKKSSAKVAPKKRATKKSATKRKSS